MEKIFEKTLLFDFYGELLTKHQQKIYQEVVFNDMSLGEAAQEYGISRQGVHDLIKRCDKILAGYEEHLHLIQKFEKVRGMVGQIQEAVAACRIQGTNQALDRIDTLASEILDEM